MSKKLSISLNKQEQIQGAAYLCISLAFLPVLFPYCITLLFPYVNDAEINFFYFCFNFLCMVMILRKFLWQSLQQLGAHPLRLTTSILRGIFTYFLLNYVVSFLLYWLAPDFFNVNDNSIALLAHQNYTLVAFGTIFLVPVAEECLYRGLVYGTLQEKSPALALILSTLLFASIHIMGYIGSYDFLHLLICFVQYLPAGFCLAWAYRRADNIFAPIFMHAIINAIGIFSVR